MGQDGDPNGGNARQVDRGQGRRKQEIGTEEQEVRTRVGSETSLKYNPTTDAKTRNDEAIRSDAALMEPAIICDDHTTTAHNT